MNLTTRQRHALVLLSDGGNHTPERLAVPLRTSPRGAAATAASLVRHGLAHRHRHRGHVLYRITRPGLTQVRHDQLRLAMIAGLWGIVLALIVVGIPLAFGRIP